MNVKKRSESQAVYITVIANTFIKSLFDLEQDKRPIHCTDKKRRQFYIKDQDQWSKDNQQSKTKFSIDKVNTKQLATLQSWKENNPSLSYSGIMY